MPLPRCPPLTRQLRGAGPREKPCRTRRAAWCEYAGGLAQRSAEQGGTEGWRRQRREQQVPLCLALQCTAQHASPGSTAEQRSTNCQPASGWCTYCDYSLLLCSLA